VCRRDRCSSAGKPWQNADASGINAQKKKGETAIIERCLVHSVNFPCDAVPTREMGAGPSAEAQGDEALWYAAAHGDIEELRLRIASAGNVNHIQRDQDSATPAIAAAQEGALDCLQLLLEQPTLEIDRADQWGYTPCHTACKWGHVDCLQLLLDARADHSRRTKDGATALHIAAEHDHVGCLKLLVPSGADTTLVWHGATPYDVAVASQSELCVEYLDVLEHLHAELGDQTTDAGEESV
jgi:hypothetical protein